MVTGTYLWYVLSHKLTLISVKAIVKSVLYSLPSVVVCWGCGQWIENEFVGVGCAVMLAGIVWMIIQVTVQTSIGKQIKNML